MESFARNKETDSFSVATKIAGSNQMTSFQRDLRASWTNWGSWAEEAHVDPIQATVEDIASLKCLIRQ